MICSMTHPKQRGDTCHSHISVTDQLEQEHETSRFGVPRLVTIPAVQDHPGVDKLVMDTEEMDLCR